MQANDAYSGDRCPPSDDRQSGAEPLVIRALWLAATVLVVGLILTVLDPSLETPLFVTLVGVGATVILVLVILWRSFDRDLFEPRVFFPLLLLGFFGVGSLPLTEWGYVPGGMYLLTLLAVSAFLIGVSLVGDAPPGHKDAARMDQSMRCRAAVLLGLLTLAGTFAFVITFLDTGVPILGAVDSGRLASAEDGYRNTLALSIRAAILVGGVLVMTGGRRPDATSWFAASVIVVGLALLFMTGNRGHLVLAALMLIAAVHYLVRRLSMRFVLAAGLVVLTIFSVAGYARASQCDPLWAEGVEDHYGVPSELAPLAPIYLAVRSVPHYFARVTDVVPEDHEYFFGRALATPIITALPGHQPGIGEIVKEDLLQLDFVGFGIAAGLYVPGYMDFGYAGVVAIMLAAGALLQLLYGKAMAGGAEWVAIYAFAVANVTLSMYGTLINSFSVLLIPAIAFSVFWLAARPLSVSTFKVRLMRAPFESMASAMTAAALAGLIVLTSAGSVSVLARSLDRGISTNQPTPTSGVDEGDGDPVAQPSVGC